MAENADRADWLTTAMATLRTDLRDTLVLVLDDITHAEAGDILSVYEGTINWRLSEACKHLKILKKKEGVA